MNSFKDTKVFRKLLQRFKIEASPKTRFNEIWKILLGEFKTYVVNIAETKLELLIGSNNFFKVVNWDLMKLDSPATGTKAVDDAL